MSERRVAAFRGEVYCRRETGAIQWCVSGIERDSDAELEVLLSGAAQLQLPPRLDAAELYVRDEPGQSAWELRSGSRSIPLPVRALQVHRRVAARFAGALPRRTAPWHVRTGWALLLNVARVPGIARLLRQLRGRDHA